jgi:hypothetical protein
MNACCVDLRDGQRDGAKGRRARWDGEKVERRGRFRGWWLVVKMGGWGVELKVSEVSSLLSQLMGNEVTGVGDLPR